MSAGEKDFVAHRFGLGPARDGEDWSVGATVNQAAALPPDAMLRLPRAAERQVKAIELRTRRRRKKAEGQKEEDKGLAKFARAAYRNDVHARILWAARTTYPFAERLLAFWSNHFTVSSRKPALRYLAGPFEAEAILPHIGGTFAQLLEASSKHQAMLTYLDQTSSIGPNSPYGKKKGAGLNENLAREILELHTLGVHGGYTQADVTEFAKLMTGWTVSRKTGESQYSKATAEPGKRVILGKTYGADGRGPEDYGRVLEALAAHPSTARHIAGKLVAHFIADQPPAAAIAAVERAFLDGGGGLPAVYRALLGLPEAVKRPGAKARSDRDFLVAALRATGVLAEGATAKGRKRDAMALTVGALAMLRQEYWSAASPAGWPETAEEWFSTAGLAGRLQLIPLLIRQSNVADAGELLERALGDVAGERTRKMVAAASNREEAMALVLASPEFNRR